MAEIKFSDNTFDSEVLKSNLPVLVDFWADWCSPCRIIAPIINELSEEYAGKLKVGKLDVDQNPNSAGKYGVMSIPTLIIFRDGKPIKTMVGAQNKENFKKGIEEVLATGN